MVGVWDIDKSSDPGTNIDDDSKIELDDPQVVPMAAILVKCFRRIWFGKP